MNNNLTNIMEILSHRGEQQYGTEAVSQLEHALQCATLAEHNNSGTGSVKWERLNLCLA